MNKRYTHYGHSSFDKASFHEVKNQIGIPKPSGGLWASPDDTDFGWKEWVSESNLDTNIDTSFSFTLKEDANVLVIDDITKLEDLPKTDSGLPLPIDIWTFLDYEKLAGIYDAIEVCITKDNRLHKQLYTWDCDTILIINPDIINIV